MEMGLLGELGALEALEILEILGILGILCVVGAAGFERAKKRRSMSLRKREYDAKVKDPLRNRWRAKER